MPEIIAPPALETPPPFNQAEYIRARNEGTAKPGMPSPAPPVKSSESAGAPTVDDDHEGRQLSRSQRREMNRLRDEAAEARGRLAAYQELQQAAKPATPARAAETEPARESFDSDAAYIKALTKWEAAQLFARSQADSAEAARWNQFDENVKASSTKFEADKAQFPDWDEAAEAVEDIQVDTEKQATFVGLLGQSDVRAAVSYHFAKHREEFEAFLKLSPEQQISKFHRLEGRLEAAAEAAQASGTSTGKTAKAPEKPAQGSANAADRDVRRPKPSSEVAARGGTPPPDEPAIGSAAWMQKRNAAQFGR